jgi:hypothetical protein
MWQDNKLWADSTPLCIAKEAVVEEEIQEETQEEVEEVVEVEAEDLHQYDLPLTPQLQSLQLLTSDLWAHYQQSLLETGLWPKTS